LTVEGATEEKVALEAVLGMDGALEPPPTLFLPIVVIEKNRALVKLEEDGDGKRRIIVAFYNL